MFRESKHEILGEICGGGKDLDMDDLPSNAKERERLKDRVRTDSSRLSCPTKPQFPSCDAVSCW